MDQPDYVVYFAHGKESGPWGTKILRLSELARAKGFCVESPDYSDISDPEKRVEKLLSLNPCARKKLVLVGSSMGAYVSATASGIINPDGLFLLAPAFYREGYRVPDPAPQAALATVVHGWRDELIPSDDIIRYCRKYNTRLHLLNGDHRLISALPVIEQIFCSFLDEIMAGRPPS